MTLPKHQRSGVTPDQRGGPARAEPEPGDHLVEDQQRAGGVAGRPQALEEPGRRRHQVHVRRDRLHDDAGRRPVELGDGVVGHDLGVGDRTGRHPGGPGPAQHRHAAAPAGEEPVGVPVVAAVELDHAVPAGGAAGEAHCAHGGLGPRGDQPDLLAPGHALADGLGQEDLARSGSPEGRPPRRRRRDRRGDDRVGVSEQDGAVGLDEVDVARTLDVGHEGPLAGDDRVGGAADRREGAHR